MEAIQREQHAAYMRDLRQSRDYKDRENKLRVLGRIQEGSVPHVHSLTTSTTFDVGTGLMISSKTSRTGLKRRGSGVETWKTLRVTPQKLLQRSPPLTFQTA